MAQQQNEIAVGRDQQHESDMNAKSIFSDDKNLSQIK